MGDVLDVEFDLGEGVPVGVGHLVDHDEFRPPKVVLRVQELPHGAQRGGGGQDDGGFGVTERGLEPFGVAGQLRGEQRDRDGAGLDRGEEAHHVIRP